MHPDLSLQRVAAGLPFTYTGADMYALCSDAMLKAITRQARAVDEKVKAYNHQNNENAVSHHPSPPITIAYFFDHLAKEEDTAVMVTEQDFIDAHRELVPSVSADELRHYDRVRRTFEGAGKKEKEKEKEKEEYAGASPRKGKGKGKAAMRDDWEETDNIIIHTENIDINGGSGSRGSSSGGGGGKGKGKAAYVANHASKNSVDIAEGGFGSAAQDDDELYS